MHWKQVLRQLAAEQAALHSQRLTIQSEQRYGCSWCKTPKPSESTLVQGAAPCHNILEPRHKALSGECRTPLDPCPGSVGYGYAPGFLSKGRRHPKSQTMQHPCVYASGKWRLVHCQWHRPWATETAASHGIRRNSARPQPGDTQHTATEPQHAQTPPAA